MASFIVMLGGPRQRFALRFSGVICTAVLGWFYLGHFGLIGRGAPASEESVRSQVTRPSLPSDRAVETAKRAVESTPSGSAWNALAIAYLQRSRVSGDIDDYRSAEAAIGAALALAPGDYETLRTRAWLEIGKHDFRAALSTASELRRRNPRDPWAQALFGDASIEVGDYDNAETAYQQMLDLRPGIPAYTRAAHLRELFGDREGARQSMEMALAAASPTDPETLAWCLVQAGHLAFGQGQLVQAAAYYQRALGAFPTYGQALAALARVREAEGQNESAIDLFRRAVAVAPTPDSLAALGDLYESLGRGDDAEAEWKLVDYVAELQGLNGAVWDRQIALFYADHGRRLDRAVAHAESDLRRRGDLYSWDTVAWAYFRSGRQADAEAAIAKALRLGTQDALLFFHAGMIALGRNDLPVARHRLAQALELNPHFSPAGAMLARRTLDEIGTLPAPRAVK